MDAMLQLGLMSDAPDSRIASANLTWVGPVRTVSLPFPVQTVSLPFPVQTVTALSCPYCVTALSCPYCVTALSFFLPIARPRSPAALHSPARAGLTRQHQYMQAQLNTSDPSAVLAQRFGASPAILVGLSQYVLAVLPNTSNSSYTHPNCQSRHHLTAAVWPTDHVHTAMLTRRLGLLSNDVVAASPSAIDALSSLLGQRLRYQVAQPMPSVTVLPMAMTAVTLAAHSLLTARRVSATWSC